MTNLSAFMLKHFSAHQMEMRKLIYILSYTQMHRVLQLKQIFGDIINIIIAISKVKCFRKITLLYSKDVH